MDASIGSRVRTLLERSTMTQRALARDVGMAPDALSRAISGQRGFAAVEVANIAQTLGVDVHWLITGTQDPRRLRIAARHTFDQASGTYENATRGDDERVLGNIRLAYRHAFRDGHPEATRLPSDLDGVRERLGDAWPLDFAQRLEDRLGVDVVRVEELATPYSFWVADRAVVALPDNEPWGRANFSLAHELAHLVAGDHDVEEGGTSAESRANRFAAELLMPGGALRAVDWSSVTAQDLGTQLWELGVTTEALRVRLGALNIAVPDRVVEWLRLPTPTFLRHRAFPASRWTAVTDRERAARARRFPTALTQALEDRVAAGQANPTTLAWVMGVDVEDLEVQPPEPPDLSTYDLAAALGIALG